MKSTVYSSTRQFTQVTSLWIDKLCASCSCVYITPCLTAPLVRLITTFACVTLPECCVDFCMGVQHSYPNLLLGI